MSGTEEREEGKAKETFQGRGVMQADWERYWFGLATFLRDGEL